MATVRIKYTKHGEPQNVWHEGQFDSGTDVWKAHARFCADHKCRKWKLLIGG